MAQNRQIQVAARRIAEKIYGAIARFPAAQGRAQLLQYALNGLDPSLSARVANAIQPLMAAGFPARKAVVQAIERELSASMHAQAGLADDLGTMSAANISSIIQASASAANALTTTIGNTVTAARQGRQVQLPAAAPAPLAPVAPQAPTYMPSAPAYTPPTPVASSTTPWGWIIGGAVAVAAVGGGAWYYSKQPRK